MSLISSIAVTPALMAMLSTGAAYEPIEAPDLPSQASTAKIKEYRDFESADNISGDKSSFGRSDTGDGVVSSFKNFLFGQDSSRDINSTAPATFSSFAGPQGIDISSHQHTNHHIDLKTAVSSGGQSYAFVKATEGTEYINPYYRSDVIELINTQTPVGFYHYAKPTNDVEEAKEEARFFVSVTGIDKGVKSLPPVLDIEENNNNLTPQELVDWTEAFVDEIKLLTGRDVMIYTYPTFWFKEMANTTQFSHLPLWIAHYNNGGAPTIPGGWSDWTFWQYTSSGRINGYGKDIDMNYFNGTEDQLRALYN